MIPEMTKEQVTEMDKFYGDSVILQTPPEVIFEKIGSKRYISAIPKEALTGPVLEELVEQVGLENVLEKVGPQKLRAYLDMVEKKGKKT